MTLITLPMNLRIALLALLCTIYTEASAMDQDETLSTLNDQKNVAVTIYNSDLALRNSIHPGTKLHLQYCKVLKG